MDGAGTETLSLQDYITSVDNSTLPRILQICSGVYFQGSVYEISGSEVCLSTGDLVKVIGIELQSVTCRDTSNNETSELPLDYAGRFQIVPEDTPFGSIEEMVELIRTEADGGDAFSFTCPHELELEGHTVPAGELISLLSVERTDGEGEGEELARCRLVGREQEEAGREILVPLSVRGVFYECGSGHGYGVREIVSSPRLRSRHYCRVSAGGRDRPVHLRPVHSVQAIMHLRKNVVQFPSSLEVDVTDVSDCCGDVVFVTPRTLAEVAVLGAEALPAVAEVLEAPESARPLFRCPWLPLLRPGQLLVLHGPADPALVLASSFKGKSERRHFLLSRRYGGGFRRRPRNFGSAYELYAAHCRGPGLTVTAATHWEATADGLTSLSVGDQLEVLGQGKVEVGCRDDGAAGREEVEVLVCRRTSDADEDDEEEEEEADGEEGRGEESHEVRLPMYLQGQFVEKLTDTKKRYSLAELGERFSFPLDVKVCRRDPGLEADPLPALSCLQLEEAVSEPAVLASLLEQPELCFLLPVRWLTMTVSFTGDALPEDQPPQPRWETVTEVTDQFYFEFRKLASQDSEAPPPRPPKRRVSTQEAAKAPPTAASNHERRPSKPQPLSQSLDKLNLGSKWPEKGPPPPPPLENADEAPPLIPRKSTPMSSSCSLPNTYTQTPKRNKKKAGRRDSDHDYEDIMDTVKNSQDSIFFY